ncbi:hypothetical protein [Mariniflexile sp.]|uniref:hypothetical protein n=1 Tax=Mariniflexile sp. TaxID=1979402 RepID=UPI004047D3FC
MKKNLIFPILLMVVACFSLQSFGQTVMPHSVPREFQSKQYTVEINGIPVEVFQASPRVHFVSFDFTDKVTVKVNGKIVREIGVPLPIRDEQVDGASVWEGGEAVIRPSSRNIKVETKGSTATFTLDKPGQYVLEGTNTNRVAIDNNDMVLFLFANQPETDTPQEADPNTIYLKAGTHFQNMDLKSGQTLYLEAGAVLYGGINIWDAHDVKILGRGVVYYNGPQSETHDNGVWHRKDWHPLTTENSERITVKGVTFVGKSRTWTLQMHSTFDTEFDNVKVLAVNDQNINGDGFDWQDGGGRSKVTNSLIRSSDDCFALFTPKKEKMETMVKDITIENCVLWPTRANIFRMSGYAENITMRNCDIIHVPYSLFEMPRALICTTNSVEQVSRVSNLLFENIRFEEPAALLGLQIPKGLFKNITFRNITMKGEPLPLYVDTHIDGLFFENVVLNGKKILSEKDLTFKVKTYDIKNLKFSK